MLGFWANAVNSFCFTGDRKVADAVDIIIPLPAMYYMKNLAYPKTSWDIKKNVYTCIFINDIIKHS